MFAHIYRQDLKAILVDKLPPDTYLTVSVIFVREYQFLTVADV